MTVSRLVSRDVPSPRAFMLSDYALERLSSYKYLYTAGRNFSNDAFSCKHGFCLQYKVATSEESVHSKHYLLLLWYLQSKEPPGHCGV